MKEDGQISDDKLNNYNYAKRSQGGVSIAVTVYNKYTKLIGGSRKVYISEYILSETSGLKKKCLGDKSVCLNVGVCVCSHMH